MGCECFSHEAENNYTSGLAMRDALMVVLIKERVLGVKEFTTAVVCYPGVYPKLVLGGSE